MCDSSILELLDPWPEIRGLGNLPTPVEIKTAVRRMRHSAGGIDGLRPEHLKSVCRDNDLFHSHVVKCVHGFWEGEEDGTFRVPKDWEMCDTVMLFKSKDAKRPENYRSIMKLVVQQKLVLVIIGQRLQRCIDSVGKKYECQNGFRFGRGIIDAVFNSRLFLKKRKEHGMDTWVLFLDLVKAFDTISREMLWDVLRLLGCPTKFVRMIKSLHDKVIIALKKGTAVLEVESLAGVRRATFWALLCSTCTWSR